MQSRDFCFWLQGFFELSLEDKEISSEQATLIRKHLNLVFKHEIDPSMGNQEHQDELNQIHDKPLRKSKTVSPSETLVRC